ncbi:YwqG family protein [Bacillus sp. XF8]|uniref:YwqG family protein n=1 Tax=Bacillus sp. XF8 TaxID=2819289 RepID=UPI001FB6D073|nr:YwqG family protein [Bacillus sp. XF8]
MEALIGKYQPTYERRVMGDVCKSIKVVSRHEKALPVCCLKMGRALNLPVLFMYPTYKEHPLHFITQLNLAELHSEETHKMGYQKVKSYISDEDLKHRRFQNIRCTLQSCWAK